MDDNGDGQYASAVELTGAEMDDGCCTINHRKGASGGFGIAKIACPIFVSCLEGIEL